MGWLEIGSGDGWFGKEKVGVYVGGVGGEAMDLIGLRQVREWV